MEGIFDRAVIQWQRRAALCATAGAGRIFGLTKRALHGLAVAPKYYSLCDSSKEI
jgi:hypothetical protein